MSFGEDWMFNGKGRHRRVCRELASWFETKYPGFSVRYGLKKYTYRGSATPLNPNLDVAVVMEGNRLLGCEVKLFAPRPQGQASAGGGLSLPAIDYQVYRGLGQALLLLKYVDFSYLVLPRLEMTMAQSTRYIFEELVEHYQPLGLIEFCPDEEGKGLEFEVTHQPSETELSFAWEKNKIISYLCGEN